MNILDKMYNYIDIQYRQNHCLLLNFTKKHAYKSKINKYTSIYVSNDKYDLECQKRFWNSSYDYIFSTNEFFNWLLSWEENMNKFNVIGNPPYDGKGNPLYLQILEKCKENAETVVWLCPSQWVKNYKDNSYVLNLKNNTCKDLKHYEFIGNPFDSAATANEVGIFVFGKANKYKDYENIRLERFKNKKLAKVIWNKFENFNSNINDYNKKDLNKKYYVRAQWIRGNQDLKTNKPKWDWTTLFGENQRDDFSFKPEESKSSPTSFWNFDTINECKNFIASTETDILMFAHYISKINQANNPQVLALIPWFGDYTHEWTEEMIAKELDLSKEEVDYIHEEMKDFGWKTRKE